jgi:dolichol-phosphate mannosyltransferase
MDADYSHNPKDLLRLTSRLQNGCDLAIGSRYCKGGNTADWSMVRLAISKIANLMASLVIGAKIHDYTSGMRCYSTNLVRNIIRDLHSQTYEIQIETIRQASIRGYRIKEIPITFVNRKKGKSKLAFNEIKQFFSYIIFKVIFREKVKKFSLSDQC